MNGKKRKTNRTKIPLQSPHVIVSGDKSLNYTSFEKLQIGTLLCKKKTIIAFSTAVTDLKQLRFPTERLLAVQKIVGQNFLEST